MPNSIPTSTLEKFTTFGDLLRFLRRRAGITQLEFSIAVGYSDSQISRLEQNLRLPDPPTIEARFVPALCLEDEPRAIARLMELAATVRREDAPALGMCPYKGLDYFDEADADLFVGREALTEQLVGRILSLLSTAQAEQSRFFTIVGASGSGKSSLVRAGLVPALHWNKTSGNWPVYILTPTAHPLESLANVFSRENASLASTAGLIDDLTADYRTLHLYTARELKRSGVSHLLLVIDQFEELFSICRSGQERLAFINNLLTAASSDSGGAIVVITLRADFYAHCASYPELRKVLASQQEYIGAMSDEEMRRAIEEPARRGRWVFEESLVELILHDVGHEPGALPLLSHALLETWRRRHGRTMTLSGYSSAGGVHGAIAETAEAVFTDQFTPQQQAIARRVFIRLTELGDETSTGDTRRRASLSELIVKPEEQELTNAVINALADARLITTDEDSVQVAHEALIREWPTLRRWLEENREGLRLHRHLTNAAQDWLASDREPDLLYRGARLAQAREWFSAHPAELNPQENEFLAACIAASERQAAEREAQHARELEAAQKLAQAERQRLTDGLKSSRRLRLRSVLISIISTIAVILAIFAIFSWQRSTSQAAVNRSRDLAAVAQQANHSGKDNLALALALEAVKLEHPPVEAIRSLREIALSSGTRAILQGDNRPVDLVVLSPDGQLALSASCAMADLSGACVQGELTLWDLDAQAELHRWAAHSAAVTAIAFTQGGQMIVSGAQDGSVILWNTAGEEVRQLNEHKNKVTGIAAFASSSLILTGSADASMLLWETKTGEILHRVNAIYPITHLAAPPTRFSVVTAHPDGSLIVWSLYQDAPINIYPFHGAGVSSIAVNPDASWVLLAGSDQIGTYLRRVDTRTGTILNQQDLPCSPARISLNSDASTALVSCRSAIYQLDLQSWSLELVLVESPGIINDLAISSDGLFGISATQNGAMSVWNLRIDLELSWEDISANRLDVAAISADGKYLLLNDIALNNFDQPGLMDLATREVVSKYYYFDGTTAQNGIAISPDGHYIALSGTRANTLGLASSIPTLMIWQLSRKTVQCQLDDLGGFVTAIIFSPDSKYLLAGSQGLAGTSGGLSLWDVENCQVNRRFDTHEDVSSVDFSSDGKRLLTASTSFPRVILWDVDNGNEIRRFDVRGEPVIYAVFTPDEQVVLGAGLGALYLWDINTGEIIRTYSAQSAVISSAALSPDGKYVLASTLNGDLLLWDFTSGEELRRLITRLDVSKVLFSPDAKTAYGVAREGKLITWQIAEKSIAELLDWIRSNRYIRDLTCDERRQYHIDPQCNP